MSETVDPKIEEFQKTRIFVNGLPKYYNEERLKKYYGKYGEVTDCKIIYKK